MGDPTHWENVYATKSVESVSWFETSPTASLAMFDALGVPPRASVIDVGAGASRLADALLDRGHEDVTLLDIARGGLDQTALRLGERASRLTLVVDDVTSWRPARRYGVWHDRAVFHFLVDADARRAYQRALDAALEPAGRVILATFAEDGPTTCSGLPVQRWTADALAEEFRARFEMMAHEHVTHETPAGRTQSFVVAGFVRR